MCSDLDNDIKIAGDRPSEDIKRRKLVGDGGEMYTAEQAQNAKLLGEEIAHRFIVDVTDADKDESFSDYDLLIQRRLLLSFTVTVAFEQFVANDALGGLAQKSFLDTVKKTDAELYRSSSDTGAFSFYYLAYRRGGDIERRIGQTFAMLCSHDGDPIFQELGEALYCWFSSLVKTEADKLNLS
jgi:hypothetical protein